MTLFRTILAAADFSPAGDNAVRRAALLAHQPGAQLSLWHVVEDGALHSLLPVSNDRTISNDRTLKMARDPNAAQGVDLVVPAQARDWRADLIVAGKQGRSTIARFLLGSVSRQLLVESDCDALNAPLPAQQAVTCAAPSRSSPRSAPDPRVRMGAT